MGEPWKDLQFHVSHPTLRLRAAHIQQYQTKLLNRFQWLRHWNGSF